MKKMTVFIVLMMAVTLSACGKEKAEINSQPDDSMTDDRSNHSGVALEFAPDSYVAVPVFTHAYICGEDVFQNELFSLYKEEEQVYIARIDLNHPDIPDIIPINIPAEQQIQKIAIDHKGVLNILTFLKKGDEHTSWSDSWDVFWHRVDREGVILGSVVIAETDFPNYYPSDIDIDVDGNLYYLYYNSVFVFGSSGDFAFKLSLDYMGRLLFKDENGAVGIHYWENEGRTQLVASIDFVAQSLGNIQDISVYATHGIINGFGAGEKGALFIANHIGAYDLNLDTMESTERVTWASVDLRPGDFNDRVYSLDEKRILYGSKPMGVDIVGVLHQTRYHLIRSKTAEDIEIEKEKRIDENGISIITLGTAELYVGDELLQAVDDFNANNLSSRIEVINYGTGYYTTPEYDAGLFRLNTDIVSGKCPDILMSRGDVSWNLYSKLGIFEDLYSFLDGDPNFEWADYQENIIRAFEIDDKLTAIPLNYFLETMAAKKSDLGNQKEWNLDEFIRFSTGFGTDTSVFSNPTKTEVLNLCLKANGESLVDWTSQNVNRDLLIKMLEFSNCYPDEYTGSKFWDVRAQNGDLRLIPIFATPSIIPYYQAILGEPVDFIGYPSEKGSGNIVTSYNIVSLSANCPDKEAAWQFIAGLLSEEAQKAYEFTSIKKSVVDKNIEKLRGYTGVFGGDHLSGLIETRELSDDDIAIFYELVNRASKIRIYDAQIDNIIKEEAGAYFGGHKSVDEVADIIENRVRIYVKEVS